MPRGDDFDVDDDDDGPRLMAMRFLDGSGMVVVRMLVGQGEAKQPM